MKPHYRLYNTTTMEYGKRYRSLRRVGLDYLAAMAKDEPRLVLLEFPRDFIAFYDADTTTADAVKAALTPISRKR